MSAPAPVPTDTDLDGLRAAAAGCTACPLYENATQTVFGAGNPGARVLLVGEQPGDVEDRRGLPFVGPAGTLLQKAVAEAGFARGEVYVTNAVKHFRFEPRGKRRIHVTPGT
jgi:DNA polymerase